MTGAKTNERPGTRAQVRYLRMSATKARVVLDLIRDKHVAEAAQILEFSERLASEHILKLLNSAIANAEHNDGLAAEELFVSACYADEGPTLKRFRPRARGRAGRINKRTCHITLIVSRLSDAELEVLRNRAERRGTQTADAAAARRRRVASSRKDGESAEAAPADDVLEAEAADEVVEAEVVETDVVETETAAVVDAPYGEGSHGLIDGDPSIMPEGFPVKGNADSMIYHNPESASYGTTEPEVWFATDEAAEAAGFARPKSQADDDTETEGDA
jgi:large subunit ribosomal protein L22